MKIFIMTDMEGCAGILNHDDWVLPTGRYYEQGKRILTEETNAVIDGLAEGGANEFLVCDGHGAGGIDPLLLDGRACLQRGWPTGAPYPFGLDATFDATACVGQHARAGTDYSHITHTGWFDTVRETFNGREVGEFGEMTLCAAEIGIPCIFAGGEDALRQEVQEIAPGAVTVGVKRGVQTDGLDHLSMADYARAKLGAVHCSHQEACRRLRSGAREAMLRFIADPRSFTVPHITAPYTRIMQMRATDAKPARTLRAECDTGVIDLLNRFWSIAREEAAQ